MKRIKGGDRQTIQGLLKTLREEDMLARVDLRNTAVGNPGLKMSPLSHVDVISPGLPTAVFLKLHNHVNMKEN